MVGSFSFVTAVEPPHRSKLLREGGGGPGHGAAQATATAPFLTPECPLLIFSPWGDGFFVKGQPGVGEEAKDQAVAVADPLDPVLGLIGDLGQAVTSEVASSAPLRLAHRPSTGLSWGRSRQPFHPEPVVLGVQVGAQLGAPM